MKALTITLALVFTCGMFAAAQEVPSRASAIRFSFIGKDYLKGIVSETSGNDYIEPKSIISWQAGLDYMPQITESLYGIVGFHVSLEPAMSFLEKPSAAITPTGYIPTNNRLYGFYSISLPIGFGYETRLKNPRWGLLFEGSFVPMFYAPGTAGTGSSYLDEANDSMKTLYSASSETAEEGGWYYQAQVAAGVSNHSTVGLVSLRLIYNHSFQNMMEGSYTYYDQEQNPVSTGKYSLSGKYVGLALSYAPNKREKKPKRVEEPGAIRELNDYFLMGAALHGSFFQKASTSNESGPSYWNQKSSYSTGIAAEMLFPLNDQFSLRSGIRLTATPKLHFESLLGPEHFNLPNFEGYQEVNSKSLCTSIPLLVDYHFQSGKNTLLHIMGGVQFNIMPVSGSTGIAGSWPTIETDSLLFLLDFNDSWLNEDAVLGVGISQMCKSGLWSLLLRYHYALKPIASGSYAYRNLNNAPDASGDYAMSGNNLSVSLIYFPRFN